MAAANSDRISAGKNRRMQMGHFGANYDDGSTRWCHSAKMTATILSPFVLATTVPHFGATSGPDLTTVAHVAGPIFAIRQQSHALAGGALLGNRVLHDQAQLRSLLKKEYGAA